MLFHFFKRTKGLKCLWGKGWFSYWNNIKWSSILSKLGDKGVTPYFNLAFMSCLFWSTRGFVGSKAIFFTSFLVIYYLLFVPSFVFVLFSLYTLLPMFLSKVQKYINTSSPFYSQVGDSSPTSATIMTRL